jgi:hypothetical protein
MSLGPSVTDFLMRCGYRDDQLAQFTRETRLLHDMGLFGDDVDDELSILSTEFSVDLSTFQMRKYFPGETGWDHFILTFFKNTSWGHRVMQKYSPITLDMIDQAIANKKWIFD